MIQEENIGNMELPWRYRHEWQVGIQTVCQVASLLECLLDERVHEEDISVLYKQLPSLVDEAAMCDGSHK